jgi:hypothetical protein
MIHDPKDMEFHALCYGSRVVQHILCDYIAFLREPVGIRLIKNTIFTRKEGE